jgi:hypothetical protein
MYSTRKAFRLKLALLTAILGIAATEAWEHHLQQEAVAMTPLHEYTPAEIVQRVHSARGRTVLLVLYSADSEGAYLAGDLRRWARQVRPRIETIAVAVGKRRDAQFLFRYGQEQGVQRIAPEWLGPSEPGTLERTMAQLGVITSDRLSPPLVAVFDPDGKATAQWEGNAEYVDVVAAAKGARQVVARGDVRE